jgi:hypothetical protein
MEDDMPVTHVSVRIKDYEELVADSLFLRNLRDAGVDNWDGYHYGWTGFEDED